VTILTVTRAQTKTIQDNISPARSLNQPRDGGAGFGGDLSAGEHAGDRLTATLPAVSGVV
jgi:hypothetical protein